MTLRPVIILSAALLGATACEGPCGENRAITSASVLVGSAVVPPGSTGANGAVSLSLVDERRGEDTFACTVRASGLSGSVTAIHLHEGPPGAVGRVLYTLRPDDQEPGPDFGSGVLPDYRRCPSTSCSG